MIGLENKNFNATLKVMGKKPGEWLQV